MDFAKVAAAVLHKREVEERLGQAVWYYRCDAGCAEVGYVTPMPAHLLLCDCGSFSSLRQHPGTDRPPHGWRRCGLPLRLSARSAAAFVLDGESLS